MLLDLSRPILAHHKAEACALRARRAAEDIALSQAQALEAVAHRAGARDWNTLHARARRKIRLSVGDRVDGRYLRHSFVARVHAVSAMPDPGKLRLMLHLDDAIDVVRFDSFSSFRQRIGAVVCSDGRTRETTSDGTPHLELTGWRPALPTRDASALTESGMALP